MQMNMELIEAVRKRHSVRQYTDKPIEPDILNAIQAEMDACNKEGGLHYAVGDK